MVLILHHRHPKQHGNCHHPGGRQQTVGYAGPGAAEDIYSEAAKNMGNDVVQNGSDADMKDEIAAASDAIDAAYAAAGV